MPSNVSASFYPSCTGIPGISVQQYHTSFVLPFPHVLYSVRLLDSGGRMKERKEVLSMDEAENGSSILVRSRDASHVTIV